MNRLLGGVVGVLVVAAGAGLLSKLGEVQSKLHHLVTPGPSGKLPQADVLEPLLGQAAVLQGGLAAVGIAAGALAIWCWRAWTDPASETSPETPASVVALVHQTLDALGDGVISTDANGRVVALNAVAEAMCGWMDADAVGRTLEDVLQLVSPTDGRAVGTAGLEAGSDAGMPSVCRRCVLVARDGRRCLITETCTTVRDAKGQFAGLVRVLRDLTELEERGARLRESELEHRLLVQHAVSAVAVHQLVFDEDGDVVDFVYRSVNPAFTRHTGLLPDEVLGKRASELLEPAEAQSLTKVFAEISLTGEARTFVQEIAAIGRRLSVNAYRLDETRCAAVFTDVTEILRAQEAIQADRRRLANVVQSTRIGTWEWHIRDNHGLVGKYWAEMLGYTVEEMGEFSFESFLALVHPEDMESVRDALLRHVADPNSAYDIEFRMMHKCGEWRWIHALGEVTERDSEGLPVTMYGTHADITARRAEAERLSLAYSDLEQTIHEVGAMSNELAQANLRLAAEQEALGAIFEAAPVGLVIVDDEVVVRRINAAGARLAGRSSDSFVGQTFGAMMDCALLQVTNGGGRGPKCKNCVIRTSVRHVFATGEPTAAAECSLPIEANGVTSESHFLMSASLVHHDGRRAVLLVLQDLADMRKADQALRESEEAFRHLFEFSADPLLLIHDGRFVNCNGAAVQLLGLTSKEDVFNLAPDELSPAIQPTGRSSKELADEMIEAATRKGVHRFEWRHRRPNGEEFDVEVMLTSMRVHGEPHMHVAWRDITERRRMEIAIRASEQRFRSLFELSPVGIVVTDYRDGQFIDCNLTFLETLGLDRDRLTPEHGHIVDQLPRRLRLQCLVGLARRGRFGPVELELDRLDGTKMSLLLNGLLLEEPDGRRTVWSLVEDFTNRKAYEASIQRHAEDLASANNMLERLANRDPLTGLVNRRRFMELVGEQSRAASSSLEQFAVLFLDLDNFKFINDTLGHEAGDQLLKQVAARMCESVLESSIVARLGGDEFAVLMPQIEGDRQPEEAADRIVKAMQSPFTLLNHTLLSTVSVGLACSCAGDSVETIIQNADTAMYYAKRAGKSAWRAFEPFMFEEMQARLKLERDLREAWENRAFTLVFQPLVDLETGMPAEVETLLRWTHPERGVVSPALFVPLAEELNLICDIGHWVLEQACTKMVAWAAEDPEVKNMRIAVNASVRQINRPLFAQEVRDVLDRTGFPAGSLIIEVTESEVMADVESSTQKFAALREIGVKIAIDDFGTGYSSMSYLSRLPLDTVKIDQSFVKLLGVDMEATAVMRALVTLCRVIDLDVVAEGIENPDQLVQVQALGCMRGQGYLFSRPMVEEDLLIWLRRTAANPMLALSGRAA